MLTEACGHPSETIIVTVYEPDPSQRDATFRGRLP